MRSYTIGRGTENDFVIDDKSVSRSHAELIEDADGSWRLRDLDSTNGTFVRNDQNWSQVLDESVKPDNDVRFGDFVCSLSALLDSIPQSTDTARHEATTHAFDADRQPSGEGLEPQPGPARTRWVGPPTDGGKVVRGKRWVGEPISRNGLTVTVGVLLILYALLNFGAAFGQFLKGDLVTVVAGAGESVGRGIADLGEQAAKSGSKGTNRQLQRQSEQARADAAEIGRVGATHATVLYVIAVFILAVAVADVMAAIGVFTGQRWAVIALVLAGIGGIIVEIQDIYEDGMGIGKILFLAVNGMALYVAAAACIPALRPANR